MFKECIHVLGNNKLILSYEESERINQQLEQMFPFEFSNINWKIVDKKVLINTDFPAQIIPALENLLQQKVFDNSIYIIWDKGGLTNIKTNLNLVILHMDDVTCVSTKTWLFNPSMGYVVEWHICGNKTVGVASKEKVYFAHAWKNCLDSFKSDLEIFSQENSKKIIGLLKNKFGFRSSLIDWKIIDKKNIDLRSPQQIISTLKDLLQEQIDKTIYILWKDSSLPVLKTNLELVITNWNQLMIIHTTMIIFNTSSKYVIETGNNDIIKIGLRPQR